MTVSFRVRYTKVGGHVHVKVWSSEFGPDTTHGLNGTLVFRESEWPHFRAALAGREVVAEELHAVARSLRDGVTPDLRPDETVEAVALAVFHESAPVVEFIYDPNAASSSPLDPGGEAR